MTRTGFTEGQKQKLLELGTDASEMERLFEDASERDEAFKTASKKMSRKNRESLEDFMNRRRKPLVRELEERIRGALISTAVCPVTMFMIITIGTMLKTMRDMVRMILAFCLRI